MRNLIPLPSKEGFSTWTKLLQQAFPSELIPKLEDNMDWKEWVKFLRQVAFFNGAPLPPNRDDDDWENWVRLLIQSFD